MPSEKNEKIVECPFVILCDSREQSPYVFSNLRTNKDEGEALIDVKTVRATLKTGDYSIMGMESICLERKTCADLFGSVARRENFEERLFRMDRCEYGAVVCECEWSEILKPPVPRFSRYSPKSLARSVFAWSQRYVRVHWWFMPGREAGEATTYRLLERYWLDHQKGRPS